MRDSNRAPLCPYCGQAMQSGYIYAPRSSASYWLGEEWALPQGILSKRSVERAGGFIIGNVTPIGFISKDKPKSHYCKSCNLLITFLCGPAK